MADRVILAKSDPGGRADGDRAGTPNHQADHESNQLPSSHADPLKTSTLGL